jgi:hypothetical protein
MTLIDIQPIRIKTDSYGEHTDEIEILLVNPDFIVEVWPMDQRDVTTTCYVRILYGDACRVERSNYSVIGLQRLLQGV